MQICSCKLHLQLMCLVKQVSSLSGPSETHDTRQVFADQVSRGWCAHAYALAMVNTKYVRFQIQPSFSELYFIPPLII